MRQGFLSIDIFMIVHSGMATNYYINSNVGSDNNIGTTKEKPRKSLRNIEINKFLPGDSILFAKGSRYMGGIIFNSSGSPKSPIVISSYNAGPDVVLKNPRSQLAEILVYQGAGSAPSFTNPNWEILNGNILRVEGSYVVIDGLYFHDNTNPPNQTRENKNVQKLGTVYLAVGTRNNVVQNCEFFNTPVGIKVKGNYNLITRNYLHDATEPMAYAWGPISIMIVGAHNEISFNKIKNYGSYGGPYEADGGAIELDGVDDDFDGRDTNIHHNISINNIGFLELAGHVENITVAYNLSDDLNQFVGGGSMKNIIVYNNTVLRVREPNVDRNIFWTFYPEETSFIVKNNIFVLGKGMQVFKPSEKPQEGTKRTVEIPGIGKQLHEHNLYFSIDKEADLIGTAPGNGDIVGDPLFVDLMAGNFRLTAESPAIDSGIQVGYSQDFDGYPVPQAPGAGKPDIGAFEF